MSSKHEPVFFQTSTTVSALFRFMACVTEYWRDGARLKLPTARIELHSVCRIEPENLLELRASESLGFFFTFEVVSGHIQSESIFLSFGGY